MRITLKDLELAVKLLNEETNNYNYQLDGAYGGWKLVVKTEFGGIREITTVRMNKHDLYYTIGAIQTTIQEEKRLENLMNIE
jgi:hypothetical protein